MDISSITPGMHLPVTQATHAPQAQTPQQAAPQTPAVAAPDTAQLGNVAVNSAQAGSEASNSGDNSSSDTPPGALQQALDEVQTALNPVARDLRFSIDDDTGNTVVKIVDAATDEVIKQIPSEELLRIAKALDKLQGLLVKQSV